ncbi:PTS sugar transporter subunit IIC [Aerococcus kribbianus]|uniref:PTS sugar transporter subunit IIC n=1 Tax=Aerococcus kribbianus TaxID=2999064 RepID=A0A9X3FML8_9LACT|nr:MULTISPECIES: PTS sugar transporter subunit IIC [unclassified Aerococcus]MCZ0717270.1 PTS sugar transporter subunit IIC [Aerococcus sp. YH-aer221]MCZ0725558.1 PTS sugar transporter subunit IIC [Aerococcus sp. YH-aer222]
MDLLIGVGLLVLVLGLFTLFTFKAPYGRKTMSAFADASVATLLVEAFLNSFVGNVFNLPFFSEVGSAAGSMGGAAAAALIPIALGASPVYGMLTGAAVMGMGILPGLVAGYACFYVIRFLDERLPEGLDLIAMIIVVAPLARFLGRLSEPIVESTLLNIGRTISLSAEGNQIIMGLIIGGIMAIVGSSPISSMALSAMLGLKGIPMGVTTMAIWSASFVNFMVYKRFGFGSMRETLSVFIEPKTQVDLTSANPIPVYLSNFLSGGLCGIIVALVGLTNEASSTATPFAGLAVMYAYNNPIKLTIMAVICALIALTVGYVVSLALKNYPIVTLEDLNAEDDQATSKEHGQLTEAYSTK